jgi:hypothetical protein
MGYDQKKKGPCEVRLRSRGGVSYIRTAMEQFMMLLFALAQPFTTRLPPLIDGHGNFGSLDVLPPRRVTPKLGCPGDVMVDRLTKTLWIWRHTITPSP